MKFKYSVIGDNTQENREWLEKVGYKLNIMASNGKLPYIYTEGNVFHLIGSDTLIHVKIQDCSINCIGNSPLFKAVSAMREDSDYMQWFTDGANDEFCEGVDFMSEDAQFEYPELWENYRKCTLTELQERFKEKER